MRGGVHFQLISFGFLLPGFRATIRGPLAVLIFLTVPLLGIREELEFRLKDHLAELVNHTLSLTGWLL